MPGTARLLLLLLAALLTAGCTRLRPASVPMRTLEIEPGAPGTRSLIVLLPGRRDSPEDFRRFGWGELARKAGVDARIVAVDAHLGYYHRRTVIDRLREDVIAPSGAEKVWLAGVSLGGTGSILYSIEHPEEVDGIAIFAPFLDQEEIQRRMRGWLETGPALPVYLGWGTRDDFAPSNARLARILPPERVFTVSGGHDWRTWTSLWERFLESSGPLLVARDI